MLPWPLSVGEQFNANVNPALKYVNPVTFKADTLFNSGSVLAIECSWKLKKKKKSPTRCGSCLLK